MKTGSFGILAGMCLLLTAAGAIAADRYVATNGLSQNNYTNWVDAATNIQTAINAASPGETVWVSNGVYVLTNEITLNKSLPLRGFKGRDQTIIDGNYSTRCITIISNINSSVDGFTIRNGLGNTYAGGIYIAYAAPYISNCIITACKITNGIGGGVSSYFINSTATFVNCVISYNTNTSASSCGGIKIEQGLVSNCWIVGNFAAAHAGGAYFGIGGLTNMTVVSCVITGNQCTGGAGGGAMYFEGGRIVNSLIAWNTAPQMGGLRIGYNTYVGNCAINSNLARGSGNGGALTFWQNQLKPGTVENCEIRGNTAVNIGTIYMYSNCVVRGCLVAENIVSNYYGAVVSDATAGGSNLVQNCTIASNLNVKTSATGGGVGFKATDRIENCIIYSNMDATVSTYRNWYPISAGTITYSCTTPDASAYGPGNTASNPQFAGSATGNYRIQQTSPCINTGSNQLWMDGAVDLDGRRRLDAFGQKVDMGAYEYIRQGTLFKVR